MNIPIFKKRLLYLLCIFLCMFFASGCQEGYQVHAKAQNINFSVISNFDKIWLSNSYVFNFEKTEGDKYYKNYYKKFPLEEGAVYVTSYIVCKRDFSTEVCEEFIIVTGADREIGREDVQKEIKFMSARIIDELKSIVGEENVEVTITKIGPPII